MLLGLHLGELTYLRLSVVSGDPRETSFLFQRLSILIQRFNSILIHESFCFNDEDLIPGPLATTIFVFNFLFLALGTYAPEGKKLKI